MYKECCKLDIVISDRHDPYVNLAIEECLFEEAAENQLILYLWRNENAVIIGRNQNPFFECRMEAIKRYHVKIVRRMTGGGAVYHDLGNLNYSLVWRGAAFSEEYIYKKILTVINYYGFDAVLSGRNDILIHNSKVSGTAYFESNGKYLQHGCILISTDLSKMSDCLDVKIDKLSGKGINSVRSRVTNLADIDASIGIEKIQKRIIDSFKLDFLHVTCRNVCSVLEEKRFHAILEKYRSDQWNYRNRGDMVITLHDRFNWGSIDLVIKTDGIEILDVEVYSDSLETGVFEHIQTELLKSKFKKTDMINYIRETHGSSYILKDICELVAREAQIP